MRASREKDCANVASYSRFLLHVLPSGFMRIRYYGFLANRHRAEKLQRVRLLLRDETTSTENLPSIPALPTPLGEAPDEHDICPVCKQGRLLTVAGIGGPLALPRQTLELRFFITQTSM